MSWAPVRRTGSRAADGARARPCGFCCCASFSSVCNAMGLLHDSEKKKPPDPFGCGGCSSGTARLTRSERRPAPAAKQPNKAEKLKGNEAGGRGRGERAGLRGKTIGAGGATSHGPSGINRDRREVKSTAKRSARSLQAGLPAGLPFALESEPDQLLQDVPVQADRVEAPRPADLRPVVGLDLPEHGAPPLRGERNQPIVGPCAGGEEGVAGPEQRVGPAERAPRHH